MDKKKKVIFGALLAAVLIVAIAVTAILLWQTQSGEMEYVARIEKAEDYLSVGQYDDAVAELNKAIADESGEPEAYILLARFYYERRNDINSAIQALERSLYHCESERITTLLARYRAFLEAESPDGEKSTDGSVTLNASLLQEIASSTYGDYVQRYGNSAVVSADGESCCVRFSGLDLLLYFENKASEAPSFDPTSNEPYNVKQPGYLVVNSLALLLDGTLSQVPAESIREIVGVSEYSVSYSAEYASDILRFSYRGCIVLLKVDANGCILTAGNWNRIIPQSAENDAETTLQGTVIDATTGMGVQNAQLAFYSTGGSFLFAIQSSSNGTYTTALESGEYTVEVSKSGYLDERFRVFVRAAATTYCDFVISPPLEEGSVRFVLEWEGWPRDLDSYLYASLDDGSSFVIYYLNTTYSANGKTIAMLDVDDMDGYGPETTTCNSLNGVLSFVVRDFGETKSMSNTRVSVKVYLSDEIAPTEIVLSGDVGNEWLVCVIDHGALTVRNEPY